MKMEHAVVNEVSMESAHSADLECVLFNSLSVCESECAD